jgi:hypothetical protein
MSFYDLVKLTQLLIEWILNSDFFIVILVGIIIAICYIVHKNREVTRYIKISDINAFNISIKINSRNFDIAYMMYVELITRKIGQRFEENDVIVEVYNSWFSAFSIIRDLLKKLNPSPNNTDLVKVGDALLNQGLRPHLTKWQARFRKWYEFELKKEENSHLSPQEIQEKYPYYKELVDNLIESQAEILGFLEQLKKIFS